MAYVGLLLRQSFERTQEEGWDGKGAAIFLLAKSSFHRRTTVYCWLGVSSFWIHLCVRATLLRRSVCEHRAGLWGRSVAGLGWRGSVIAVSPLFWNNGWSLQLSLSRIALDSLIPLMRCAARHAGGLHGGRNAFRHFRNVVSGMWLYPIQLSEPLSNQSSSSFFLVFNKDSRVKVIFIPFFIAKTHT